MKRLIFLFFNLCLSISYAQPTEFKADSLEKILETRIADTLRTGILLQLSKHYGWSGANPKLALQYAQEALKISEKTKDTARLVMAYKHLSTAYSNFSNYSQMLQYAFKTLSLAEKINDKLLTANTLYDLSFVYRLQKEYDNAILYAQKGLAACTQLENNEKVRMILTKALGDAYSKQQKYDSALFYFYQTRSFAQKMQEYVSLASSHNAIGIVERERKHYDSAKWHHEQALAFYQKSKFNGAEVITLNNLAMLFLAQNKISESERYATEAFLKAQNIKVLEFIKTSADILYQINQQKGNFEQSLLYFQTATSIKDSLFSAEKSKAISEMQANYDFEKQEQEIALLNKDNALQNTILLALGATLALIVGILGLVYKASLQRKRANEVLKEKNRKIEIQNYEILSQHQELQQQQEEIIAQKDYIEKTNQELSEKNKTVEDSILAARSIQYALLPQKKIFLESFTDYFIVYKPKDVVSGDFYWSYTDEHNIYLAVVDCTGHGVPGAFTSIVGSMLLNRIVGIYHIDKPAEILNQLQNELSKLIVQNQSEEIKSDIGMDIILLRISKNKENIKLTFAGAKRPLFYYDSADKKLKSLIPTRQSIKTWHDKPKFFGEQEITLSKDSILYLSTDGFPDQNNLQRESIGSSRFAQILEQCAHLDLAEQKNVLETFFENHKRGTLQRDDVLVLGIRL